MTTERNIVEPNRFPNQLYLAKSFVYDKCNFNFGDFILEKESQEYGACSFTLNGMNIQFRTSKITPTKTGQFVTIWKRNQAGITQPFDLTDNIDFFIISSQTAERFGQFIFPKSLLLDKGIITGNQKEGKRGIRVYPPWDIATNKQAAKTQNWQTDYFFAIEKDGSIDFTLIKNLFLSRPIGKC